MICFLSNTLTCPDVPYFLSNSLTILWCACLRPLLGGPCLECPFLTCLPDKVVLILPDTRSNVPGEMSQREAVHPTCCLLPPRAPTLPWAPILSNSDFSAMICQQQFKGWDMLPSLLPQAYRGCRHPARSKYNYLTSYITVCCFHEVWSNGCLRLEKHTYCWRNGSGAASLAIASLAKRPQCCALMTLKCTGGVSRTLRMVFKM